MRVVEQTLRQRAADPDGISLNQNYIADDPLVFDGVLAITSIYDGSVFIDLSPKQDTFLPSLIEFNTGATGSVAIVLITGFDELGRAQTESVTMPGAASAVESTKIFTKITSMVIDGVATNLSVGIPASDQFGPWIPLDRNIPHFSVLYQVTDDGGTVNVQLQHTIQKDLLRNGPDGKGVFDDSGLAGAVTGSSELTSVVPVVASRVRINLASSAAVALFRVNQSGHAN